MHDKHEPRSEFIEKLEWTIAQEVRRRNRSTEVSQWVPQTRMKAGLAGVALVVVSLSVGAAGVAAAYQAQNSQRREALMPGFERRAELASQRLKLAADERRDAERRMSIGAANQEDVLEAGVKVTGAEAELKSLQSQMEEIRITGREPSGEISALPVSRRDFIGERLRIEMAAPQAALGLEQSRLTNTERRVAIGAADPFDVEAARMRVTEAEAAVEGFLKRIELRQLFLARKVGASAAALRVLEIEAEQRRKTIGPKVELARKELQRTAARVTLGAASTVDQAEAALRLQKLETERAAADLDLARIHSQQGQKGR